MPSLQSQLLDCSATLDRLNELKLLRRSLKYLEVIFKVMFFLALPSRLLKPPIALASDTETLGTKCDNVNFSAELVGRCHF